VIVLLPIFLILTVKKFENWSVFHEVIRCTKMCHFWPPGV